jgi:hypothetical protein
LITERCDELREVASAIDPDVVFVQYKPPKAPESCFLGYVHPVLNCDGYVYPCDSCTLNSEANHKFANPWRVCHWSEIAKIYDEPVRSLVDSKNLCPGCVFSSANDLLREVVNGVADVTPSINKIEHVNFV